LRAPLPTPRGPLSDALVGAWSRGAPVAAPEPGLFDGLDPLTDDDLHLALWCCYQLAYGGFHHLDDELEWDPATLALRRALEERFEQALREEHAPHSLPDDPVTALRVIAEWAGPGLAAHLASSGERWQLEEFAIHRSAYQLKEADGHTWGLPRLSGRTKATVIEIQLDEYGSGVPGRAHADLFAAAMDELGLESTHGHYIDALPGVTLATDNLLSLFGLHLRLSGALVGHLAHFEMCSAAPMSKYLVAARRLGNLPRTAEFYEVHVAADAHHGAIALDHAVAPFAAAEPDRREDIIFGAASLSRVEARFARHVLDAWGQGVSSLRPTRELQGVGAASSPATPTPPNPRRGIRS
jgi:hypothetical protein